jgi:hypothetical protein
MESEEDQLMPPNKRTLISKYPGNIVTAGGSDTTDVGQVPIPAGKSIRITCFGGALTHAGTVELQLRTDVGPPKWRTLRCVVGPGDGHFENFQPIEGDGVIAALRIVRTNEDASNRKIKAWCEGFRR